jgi:hypothetical protein
LADDGLATGFDCAGADEVAEFAEVGVTHPLGVGLEVAQRLVDLEALSLRQVELATGFDERRDVTAVEVGESAEIGLASQIASLTSTIWALTVTNS